MKVLLTGKQIAKYEWDGRIPKCEEILNQVINRVKFILCVNVKKDTK